MACHIVHKVCGGHGDTCGDHDDRWCSDGLGGASCNDGCRGRDSIGCLDPYCVLVRLGDGIWLPLYYEFRVLV
jgi:hypothetical protein